MTSDEWLALIGSWLNSTSTAQWLWVLSASTIRLGLRHDGVADPLIVLARLRTLMTFKGRLWYYVRLWKHLYSLLRRLIWLMLCVVCCRVHAHKLVLAFLLSQFVQTTLYYCLFRRAVESGFLATIYCLRVKLLSLISKCLLWAFHHFSHMRVRYEILRVVFQQTSLTLLVIYAILKTSLLRIKLHWVSRIGEWILLGYASIKLLFTER